MKTLAIIIVGAALASSAWAADLTVAIEEGGTGPLGQWYLDYEMRKHIRHLDTIQAVSEAKEVMRCRERLNQEEEELRKITDTTSPKQWAAHRVLSQKVEFEKGNLKLAEQSLAMTLAKLNDAKNPKKQKSLKEEEAELRQTLAKLSQEPGTPKALPVEVRRAIPVK